MTLLRSGFLLLVLTLLAACTSVVPPAKPPGSTTAAAPIQLTQGGIMAAINGTRAAAGKPPLRYSIQLESAARSQANLMAARDTLSHDLGVTLRQRVTTAGYDGAVGENVAGGQATLEQAINGWMASPASRNSAVDQVPGIRAGCGNRAGQPDEQVSNVLGVHRRRAVRGLALRVTLGLVRADPHPCPLPLRSGRETLAEMPVLWSPSPFRGATRPLGCVNSGIPNQLRDDSRLLFGRQFWAFWIDWF